MSREILQIRARASWGRPSHFSPTQEFLAAEGVLSVQGRVSVNKPLPQVTPPHPTPSAASRDSVEDRAGGDSRQAPRASSSARPQENTDKQRREGEACHGTGWGCSEGSTGQISTDRARQCSDPKCPTKELTFHTYSFIPGAFTSLPHSRATGCLWHPTLPAPDATAFRDQKPGHSPLNLGDIHLRNHVLECLPLHKAFLPDLTTLSLGWQWVPGGHL